MLRFLLKWKSYRTLKSGLLLDFLTKRLIHKISIYFFYIFTVFFGDKYILDHFMSNLSIFFNMIANKIKSMSKDSFIDMFKFTMYMLFYTLVILAIFYII